MGENICKWYDTQELNLKSVAEQVASLLKAALHLF